MQCLIAWLILNQLALSKTRITNVDNKTIFFSISHNWILILIEFYYKDMLKITKLQREKFDGCIYIIKYKIIRNFMKEKEVHS